MFEKKKCPFEVSTIKCYRSMIANTLKFKSGTNLGSDPIISELIKAFEIQRTVQRSLAPKWDSSLCKDPHEPLHKASLLHPTVKTAFLLTVATAKRVIEIHAWAMDSEHLRFNKTDGSVSLRTQTGFLARHQLPSESPSTINIQNLAKTLTRENNNRLLCPVRALKGNLDMTKAVRKNRIRLFIPIKRDHDVTKGSIARWIAFTIKTAYRKLTKRDLSLLKIKAYELRALSTSWAYFYSIQIKEVIQAAVWSNQTAFAKCYLRDMHRQQQNLCLLGQVVADQKVMGAPMILPLKDAKHVITAIIPVIRSFRGYKRVVIRQEIQ